MAKSCIISFQMKVPFPTLGKSNDAMMLWFLTTICCKTIYFCLCHSITDSTWMKLLAILPLHCFVEFVLCQHTHPLEILQYNLLKGTSLIFLFYYLSQNVTVSKNVLHFKTESTFLWLCVIEKLHLLSISWFELNLKKPLITDSSNR